MRSESYSNGGMTHAVSFAKPLLRPLSSGMQGKAFTPLRIRQFTHAMSFAPMPLFRMRIGTVPFASCHALRMEPCRMVVAAQDKVRACDSSISAFRNHVLHVVRMRTQKEADFVVDAAFYITRVADKQSIWRPFACFEEPGDDVGARIARFVRCGAKVAVAVGMRRTCPHPALAVGAMAWCLVDLGPKARRKTLGLDQQRTMGTVTGRAAVFPGLSLPRGNLKGLCTQGIGTDQSDWHDMTSLSGQGRSWLGSHVDKAHKTCDGDDQSQPNPLIIAHIRLAPEGETVCVA